MLAPLSDETATVASIAIVNFFLIFVANWRAIDDYAGAVDRFFGFQARRHSHLGEFRPAIFIDGELGALPAGNHNLRAIGGQRGTLVKRYFIDAKLLPEGRKNSYQRFADGPGADDVYDLLAGHILSP